MASGGFFRGTSVDQDSRFFNQNKKLLAKLSFPPSFDRKVDVSKIKMDVIHTWITERVTQLLGFEDDIVVAMIINLLAPKVDEKLDPRQMQLTLTGFLEKDTPVFMNELWELLLSAQDHPTGIPPAILEKKKAEMAQVAAHKQQLKTVLDRKQQDARGNDRVDRPRDTYGLQQPTRERRGRPERPRSPPQRSRRPRSRSTSRSRSYNRRSRSRSRSRSDSRGRSTRSRRRRSPSSSPDRRRRRSRSRRRDRRRRSVSSSRSASPDPFGRRPRPTSRPRSRSVSSSSSASSR